ncbi:hypothetical protein, partial [Gemmatimonas sp.]|uniref:hypothetical protein n=1 Tax=Gemmatimonas sp. TaxID=1962908 RepID=UPI0037C04242
SIVKQRPSIESQPLAAASLSLFLVAAVSAAAHIFTKLLRACQYSLASYFSWRAANFVAPTSRNTWPPPQLIPAELSEGSQ